MSLAASRWCPDRCLPPPPCELNYLPSPCVCTDGAVAGAPRITSSTTASGRVGTAFSYQITATGSPTSWNATAVGGGPLPAWLSINTATGQLTGTPTAVGPTVVVLSATNAEGTGTRNLTINVQAAPVVVGPAYFGTIPTNNIPDETMILTGLTNGGSIATPASGSTMTAILPVGGWGWCFAYPASLPAASGIQDSVAGPVLSAFTQINVTVNGENYRVYYLRTGTAQMIVPGTNTTLTIGT